MLITCFIIITVYSILRGALGNKLTFKCDQFTLINHNDNRVKLILLKIKFTKLVRISKTETTRAVCPLN